ncbi:uncharacterized protein LOC110452367 [Mizuhopecten yessoensis]|uniref:Hemicentin-2 n=1 Tax=Mizuhopecten yessoensis TaxID=6573 RepID=A0A210QJR5_MIZYE|nr:uncharacterized protein LOC110452367 [Mizuhopecten yessoensis]XP_021356519.1 uncharacterized protein LOC110452367 [Mizuhopecten yessoensis]OWF48980.1 peroxidasin [Mizuhopecten yessoensis]
MRTLVVLAVLCSVAECTQLCYKCNGVPSQSDCGETIICGPHESCYTKRYTGPSGNLMFESGCMAKTVCSVININFGGAGRRKRELVNCLKCCDSEAMGCTEKNTTACGCNADLCNTNNDHGTKCFHCDDVYHPNQCSELKECFSDRICYTRKIELDSNGEKRFSMGCEQKRVCDVFEENALSTDEGTYCTRCCNASFCNMALCGIPQLVIPSFTRKPNDRKVLDGDIVTLHCEVDPKSNATITWAFQSYTGLSTAIPSSAQIMQRGTRVQIRVTRDVLGSWTCTAKNSVGTSAAVAKISSALPVGSG